MNLVFLLSWSPEYENYRYVLPSGSQVCATIRVTGVCNHQGHRCVQPSGLQVCVTVRIKVCETIRITDMCYHQDYRCVSSSGLHVCYHQDYMCAIIRTIGVSPHQGYSYHASFKVCVPSFLEALNVSLLGHLSRNRISF